MPEQVKLKRRHIKEDKFADFVLSARMQATENWQILVIGIVVVGLLVAGSMWYMNSARQKATESAGMLARGMMEYRSGNVDNAVANWRQIIEDNDNANAVEQATYLLGSTNLERRNYPEAIRFFEEYARKYRSNKLHLAAALGGIGLSYEAQGQFAEAADKYMEAAKADTAGALAAESFLAAMRNYINAGNLPKAEEQYQYIISHFKDTESAGQAEFLHAEKMNG